MIPTLQHFWLAFGQIAAHWKPCFRKVQGIFILTHRFLIPLYWAKLDMLLLGGINRATLKLTQPHPCCFSIQFNLLL
ncbi:Uncharacterised protein [Vibrio cholerae]|nr:Uncharacterised protein [Vibrio cholerae]CSC05424.1 Uncharacterised protein [Vibrio cholerae]CSI76892.1 Uncharacterised protein [Vibrio cholerae]